MIDRFKIKYSSKLLTKEIKAILKLSKTELKMENINEDKCRNSTLIKEQSAKKMIIMNWHGPNSKSLNNVKHKQKEIQRKSSVSYHFPSAGNSHYFVKLDMIWKSPYYIVELWHKGEYK